MWYRSLQPHLFSSTSFSRAEVSNLQNWIVTRVNWLDNEFALVAHGDYVYPVSNQLVTPAAEVSSASTSGP